LCVFLLLFGAFFSFFRTSISHGRFCWLSALFSSVPLFFFPSFATGRLTILFPPPPKPRGVIGRIFFLVFPFPFLFPPPGADSQTESFFSLRMAGRLFFSFPLFFSRSTRRVFFGPEHTAKTFPFPPPPFSFSFRIRSRTYRAPPFLFWLTVRRILLLSPFFLLPPSAEKCAMSVFFFFFLSNSKITGE